MFKLTPKGVFSTLHNFCTMTDDQGSCADGILPDGRADH